MPKYQNLPVVLERVKRCVRCTRSVPSSMTSNLCKKCLKMELGAKDGRQIAVKRRSLRLLECHSDSNWALCRLVC